MPNDSTTAPSGATLGESTGPTPITGDTPLEQAGKFAADILFAATAEAEGALHCMVKQIDNMLPTEAGQELMTDLYGLRAHVFRLKNLNSVCMSMFIGMLGSKDITIRQASRAVHGFGSWEELRPLMEAKFAAESAESSTFMAGLQLGVDMARAAEVHQNTDTCDIHIGNRLGRPFLNVARPFVDRLLEAPELAEGFAAVLSHGLSVNGNGTAHECSGLKFQDVHGPWDGLFPDGKVADEAVHAAYVQAHAPKSTTTKPQRASRAKAPAMA